jgi:hypothetical protein
MGETATLTRRRRAAPAALAATAALCVLVGCTRPSGPQVQGPLAIDIPELCTRCVEVLRCEGGGRRVAYVLAEKSAWAQVVTIWDYFAAFFRPKTEDFRDLTRYELGERPAEVLSREAGLQARLDVWQRRVELHGAVVEQKSGAWLTVDGRPMGACTHLPRGEDRRYAAQLEGPRGS